MPSTQTALIGLGALVGLAFAASGAGGATTDSGPKLSALRLLGERVASDIRAKGMDYDRALLEDFQGMAGIKVDGKYGLNSRAALFRAGVKNPPPALYGRKPKSDGPQGSVTLGPLTEIKTAADGTVTRETSDAGMSAADKAAWEKASPDEVWDDEWEAPAGAPPKSARDVWDEGYDTAATPEHLLTDDQADALTEASQATATASRPGASMSTMERALRAAQKAAALMSRDRVPPISAADEDDFRAAPIASLPPATASKPKAKPTPINLELARREAPSVSAHITKKGKLYSRQMVRDFQAHSGLVPDGAYGPITESALRYFGIINPPPYLAQPKNPQAERVYRAPRTE